jgi:hypothetical protein
VYLEVEGVRGAVLVQDGNDREVAGVALVDQVHLQGIPLAVDGVLGGHVPVHLVQVVQLAVHGDVPDLVLERQLHCIIRKHRPRAPIDISRGIK